MERASPRIAKWENEEFKKRYGAYDTPLWIVKLMIKLSGFHDFKNIKVLEPACGLAPFSYVISRLKGSWRGITGVEIDPEICKYVKMLYPGFDVRCGDYLLMNFSERYDLIIGNPPYGIIGEESHYAISSLKHKKSIYKSLYTTWLGKYNIYGLFIEKGVNDLKEKGKLVYIIPATWMILDEFKKLRAFLAKCGKIKVYYLGKGVFKNVNVTSVILVFEKGEKGLELYEYKHGEFVLNKVNEHYKGEMVTFTSPLVEAVEKRSKFKIGDLFDVRISPRSPEIKRLPFIHKKYEDSLLPILNGKNLKKDMIEYSKCYSGYYVKPEDVSKIRPWFTIKRIVVGHTKGGKIVSAICDRPYAWMGDVYHLIPRSNLISLSFNISLEELNRILNSVIMNKYVKDKYKDITPHITKTQLLNLPILKLNELKRIYEEISSQKSLKCI